MGNGGIRLLKRNMTPEGIDAPDTNKQIPIFQLSKCFLGDEKTPRKDLYHPTHTNKTFCFERERSARSGVLLARFKILIPLLLNTSTKFPLLQLS